MDMLMPLLLAVGGLVVLGSGVHTGFKTVRRQREHQRLDEVGVTAAGAIVEVEPLQREVNQAAGQPVTYTFTDRNGVSHRVRDTSGLGGYLVREGTPIGVTYAPDDPQVARIDELTCRSGPYPAPDPARSWTTLVTAAVLVVAGAAGVIGGLVAWRGAGAAVEERFQEQGPVIFAGLGVLLTVIGAAVLVSTIARRRRLREQTTGTVTEVWRRSSGGRNQTTTYSFTVHFVTSDGREVHTKYPISSNTFRPRPEQAVRVRYDPEFPPRFVVRGTGFGQVLLGVIPLLIGVVFTAIGVSQLT